MAELANKQETEEEKTQKLIIVEETNDLSEHDLTISEEIYENHPIVQKLVDQMTIAQRFIFSRDVEDCKSDAANNTQLAKGLAENSLAVLIQAVSNKDPLVSCIAHCALEVRNPALANRYTPKELPQEEDTLSEPFRDEIRKYAMGYDGRKDLNFVAFMHNQNKGKLDRSLVVACIETPDGETRLEVRKESLLKFLTSSIKALPNQLKEGFKVFLRGP